MSDTPGKVLSSLPASSKKRKSSKVGGCAAVFFQIFHGKRLFPRKSLPAERPKQGSINHTDDKLPMGKLLLVADENIGVFPKGVSEEPKEDIVAKDEPCKEKTCKRTLSVVARLMGLETMPSPELPSGKRKQFEPDRTDMEYRFTNDVLQERHHSMGKPGKNSVCLQQHTLPNRAKTEGPDGNPLERFQACQKAPKSKDEACKSVVFSKCPPLPPHQLDSLFPSVIPSSKKGSHRSKSSMPTKRTTHLFEAAAKILQPNSQSNTPVRNQGLHSQRALSRTKNSSSNVGRSCKDQAGREQSFADPNNQAVLQLNGTTLQAPSSRQEKVKTQIGSKKASSETVNRRRGSPVTSNQDMCRPQVTCGGPQQVVLNNKGSIRETGPVKRNHSYQQELTRPRANMQEKLKPDWRRQEETSRRLSQPGACSIKIQSSRPLRAKQFRYLCPPKYLQVPRSGPSSSQANKSMLSSDEGTLSSQPINSHISSNSVPTGSRRRHTSSFMNGCVAQTEESSNSVEMGPPTRPLYRGGADISHEILSVSRDSSVTVSLEGHSNGEADNSSCSHDGSNSSTTYTQSQHTSSMESALSSDPSLSEFTSNSEEHSSFLAGADVIGQERIGMRWETGHSSVAEPKRVSDICMPEDSTQSSCCDSFFGDSGDTASSHAESNVGSRRPESVSYSGKNTAAILQELLMALSSSRSPLESDDRSEDSRIKCMDSCSSESGICRHVEKSKTSRSGYSEYTKDSLHTEVEQASPISTRESPFQDSASSKSSNSFKISQGRKQCESNNIESMDFTSISDTEVVVDANFANRTGMDGSQPEEGDSVESIGVVDCDTLMDTISRLHHIDPEVIGLNVRATRCQNHDHDKVTIKAASMPGEGLPGPLIGPALFDKLEEQAKHLDWGPSISSTSLSAEDEDTDSLYRSEIESSFRSQYEESAVQNRNLVSDCINEAFKSMGRQLYGFSSGLPGHLSATHVLSRVYKQIDEWRGMAISMNLDDMVEKEMNASVGRWHDFGCEAEEVAEVVENTIFSRLMEELVLELV